MNLEQIRAKQAEIALEMKAIADSLVDGEATDEQREKFDALQSEHDELEATATTLEADAKRKESAAAILKQHSPGRKTQPTQPGEARLDSTPAIPRRGGKLKNFKGESGGRTAEERAYRFGMWSLATIANDMPGRFRFPKAQEFVQEHMAVHNEGSGSSGAHYLVPEEFGNDMIDLREVYGVARRLLRMRTMASDVRSDPRRTGGLSAYFVGESQAGTESTKSWGNVKLTAKDLMVISRYSSQLSQDAVVSIGDDLAGEISYAFANKEDDCAFNGDGGSLCGGIVGIRTKLQNVDGNGADSFGLKTQGTGTNWGAIVLGDFDKVVGALPQYADTPNTAWTMHRTFFYEIVEKLVQASGGTTAMETREGERRPRPIFKGYPVEFSQVFPNATATSSVVAALGDYAEGASFGDRQQEEISFSEHATVGGESLWERKQFAIRGCQRFDINVHDAGSTTEAGPIVGLQTGS